MITDFYNNITRSKVSRIWCLNDAPVEDFIHYFQVGFRLVQFIVIVILCNSHECTSLIFVRLVSNFMLTTRFLLKWLFISLFERAFKMMKNGVYFIVIAPLVAELFKILIYAN